MRNVIIGVCAFIVCAVAGIAYADEQTTETTPHRVLLTWDGDPAKSMAVSWRTRVPVDGAIAQVAPANASPVIAFAKTVQATSQAVETTAGVNVHYHTASFGDLKPSTKYAYRVGGGTGIGTWSEWNHFTTASDKADPFTFLYVGDAQTDVKSLWSRVIRDAFRYSTEPKFIVHAGDLINYAHRDEEWGEWFDAAGWINRVMPSFAIPGNHEYFLPARNQPRVLSKYWRPQFEYPKNGPAGLEDTAYYIDYQGVRIVGLNTNEKWDEQAPWLDKVLSENQQKWTILTFHHPVYAGAAYRDSPWVRKAWAPIIDKHPVDLVLQGHDHTYARTQSVTSGTLAGETGNGAVYVVSVSGSKMYRTTTATIGLMARVAEDTQFYQVISVNGDKLTYEARTAAGDVYDAFDLEKIAGSRRSRLINRIPDTAVRRRSAPKTID